MATAIVRTHRCVLVSNTGNECRGNVVAAAAAANAIGIICVCAPNDWRRLCVWRRARDEDRIMGLMARHECAMPRAGSASTRAESVFVDEELFTLLAALVCLHLVKLNL